MLWTHKRGRDKEWKSLHRRGDVATELSELSGETETAQVKLECSTFHLFRHRQQRVQRPRCLREQAFWETRVVVCEK